ncbi:murein L,D-transpeptidase catalytic domain family protein [Thaumasiovibrio sp. DFM-14]|uniref:murein L,D-transpeptidase catalytic domain family protein n=1 Tax=Thaumasiovibrio sp. DFM-14 TaxID=3384792 RepID=UPI0039A03B4E
MNTITKQIITIIFFLFLSTGYVTASTASPSLNYASNAASDIYRQLKLENRLDYEVFENAVNAYNTLDGKRSQYLSIIDYTKSSTEKRFFVIDMKEISVLFNTYVAHGKNSGSEFATRFSNTVNSKKTSLGVFITSSTYNGSNGYSLRLDGLSPGQNDNARDRYIVIHGANYAEESFIQQNGQLGRSWGCPAVPMTLARNIIDTIKNGSVVYAHG